VGELDLKGFTRPVTAFRILRLRPERARYEVAAGGR